MNKNTKTYLLLGAAAVVWSLIIYKIVNGVNPKIPLELEQETQVSFNPKNTIKADTFTIQPKERDPFLGTLASAKKPTFIKSTKPTLKKTPLPTPNITYSGMVKKQQSTQQIFVVTINNKQHLLKKGQEADSVKLISGTSKQIKVRFRGKTEIIEIQ